MNNIFIAKNDGSFSSFCCHGALFARSVKINRLFALRRDMHGIATNLDEGRLRYVYYSKTQSDLFFTSCDVNFRHGIDFLLCVLQVNNIFFLLLVLAL